jgi:hypothetical protein
MPDQPAIDLYTDRLVERAVKAEMRVTKLEWELRVRKWPGDWQPIDTAPKKIGKPILVFTGGEGDGVAVVGWSACNEWEDYNGCVLRYEPTHWLPLPTAPTTEGE